MAQMSCHRRRAQIASAALVLIVAAGAGIGQDDSAAASVTAALPDAGAETQSASRSDAIRVLDASRNLVPKPTESDGIPVENPPTEPGSQDQVIYLTFDDGPSPYTKRVLNLLDEYDAQATFFQVGENAVAHPNLARAVVARGHVVGNHTWSHRDMRKLRPIRLNGQIDRTSHALRRVIGQPVTCLRPPYGAVNRRVKAVVRGKKLALKLWDVDPRDWKRPGAAVIARRVVSRATPGDVILLHDGGGNRTQSVRALGRILRTLSEKGYTFKTLPGC